MNAIGFVARGPHVVGRAPYYTTKLDYMHDFQHVTLILSFEQEVKVPILLFCPPLPPPHLAR